MELYFFRIIFITCLNIFGIIYTSEWEFPYYKCLDDSLETKGICGIKKNLNGKDFLYISKTCRRNQLCSQIGSDSGTSTYKCQKSYKKRHEGKKCKIGADCLSGICDKKCKRSSDGKCASNSNYACEKGKKFCKDGSCTDFINIGNPCNSSDVCEPMNGCNYGDGNGICTKYGSLSDGDQAYDGIFCNSGIIDPITNKCISVEKDSECKESNGKYECTPTVNGTNTSQTTVECELYNKNPICSISRLKSSFFSDYIKKYNSMNTGKILKKKKFSLSQENGFYFYNNNLMKKYFKYRYFEKLRSIGVMNEEGKIEKDCEFDYYLKDFRNTNSAYYIKSLGLGIFCLIIHLL